MAKIDRKEDLPTIFRDNNLFLLPISRKRYAIVKGSGYHQLEVISEKPIIHYTQNPFPETFANFESEQVYLDYAYSTGLIERFVQIPLPNPPSQIRRNTPVFDLKVDNCNIHVDKAQIEVDAITEGLKTIVIIEAKTKMPSSFNIRQIYYPFRTFLKNKKVRSIFFCFEQRQGLYLFWEYAFNPYDSLESINLIQSKQYQIKVSKVLSVKQFQDIQPAQEKIKIPQADKVDRIIQYPLMISQGHDTAEKMMSLFDFTNRQSSYYRHASEILGLVKSDDNNKYKLTDRGKEYLELPAEKRANFICRLLLEFPMMNEIFLDISLIITSS